jgi:hypothetical protein
MSYLNRLKCRIQDEGLLKTVHYGALVGYDTFNTLLNDAYLDIKYSGKPLNGNKQTSYKYLGANDVYHTDYAAMPHIFKQIDVKKDDVLVDIGCGKGRVINYWLNQNYQNPIYGLELDEKVAKSTAQQFMNRSNVKIIAGDAVQNLPEDGTIFYFYNPFDLEKFVELENKLAKSSRKQLKMLYYNPRSLRVFENSKWQIQKINFEHDLGIKRWGRLNKYHDLAVIQPAGRS